MSDAMAEALRDECRAIGCDLTCRKCSTRDAADRIAALEAERDEWKQAATSHHSNPADFRYWEGRYRDERARGDRLEAEVARLREALERIAKDGYGLQGVQEDAGGDANRYNYLAAEYWANEVKWRRSVARAALTAEGDG